MSTINVSFVNTGKQILRTLKKLKKEANLTHKIGLRAVKR